MSGRKEKAKRRWKENALLSALQYVADAKHKTQADKDAALWWVLSRDWGKQHEPTTLPVE